MKTENQNQECGKLGTVKRLLSNLLGMKAPAQRSGNQQSIWSIWGREELDRGDRGLIHGWLPNGDHAEVEILTSDETGAVSVFFTVNGKCRQIDFQSEAHWEAFATAMADAIRAKYHVPSHF